MIGTKRKLFELTDDLGEWREILEEAKKEGWKSSKIVWGNLTLERITELVKDILKEFDQILQSVNGKIDTEEKRFFQKISIRTKLSLGNFGRKER